MAFTPLMRFLPYSLVSSSFLVRLKNLCFISTCLMVSASNISKYLQFSFSSSILIFSKFSNSIRCRFLLLLICMAHFSMPNTIPVSWQYIFTAYIRISSFFTYVATNILLLLLLWELADCLSLESEWQQVSSSLQDSFRYSGSSQQCCSLDCFHSSRYFQLLPFLLPISWWL